MTMRYVMIIISLGFISQNIQAQSTDIIKFKDKSEYRGNIKEYKEGEYLKVEVGGTLITIDENQLANIKEIGFDKLSIYSNKRGFWKELQVGMSVGQSNGFRGNESHPVINVVSGYQFNQYLGVGLGSGYQHFSRINIVPIYASLRGDLLSNQIAPFYYFNLGYAIGIDKKDGIFFDDDLKMKGGFLLGSGLGLRFKLKKSYLTTSVGYKLQKSRSEREFSPIFFDTRFAPGGDESIIEKRTYKRMEIKIGIGF